MDGSILLLRNLKLQFKILNTKNTLQDANPLHKVLRNLKFQFIILICDL